MILGSKDSFTSIDIGSTKENNQYLSMNKNDRSNHSFVNILFLYNAVEIKKIMTEKDSNETVKREEDLPDYYIIYDECVRKKTSEKMR